ncbi:hypothetical protein DPMN_128228 [Dreissena polymorpha]|uniref:Uncharacterized protein n=1 Tax=Dreissena polymorpha TaxID=45954 RepID=A0A9D4H0G1_DREPO|nr:hypothetical protein DPMN_128228 [Dreissena polymorpha]
MMYSNIRTCLSFHSSHKAGVSLQLLMLGRHLRLAFDDFLELPTDDIADRHHTENVTNVRKILSESYDIACQNARSSVFNTENQLLNSTSTRRHFHRA